MVTDDAHKKTPHAQRFHAAADEAAKPEGPFQRATDWVSAAQGRPANILFWMLLVVIWTFIFAAKLVPSDGSFLPSWFTGQGYNFPLNLLTTVAELFIGFLVAAAANRSEAALTAIIDGIRTVLDHVNHAIDNQATVLANQATVLTKVESLEEGLAAEIRANTELTQQTHDLAQQVRKLSGEIHQHVCSPRTGARPSAAP